MADPDKRANIDRLLLRIDAVRAARRYKYVMMNAPGAALPAIKARRAGPQVADRRPARRSGWVASTPRSKKRSSGSRIERLRAAGASEILVSSLEKLLL